MLHGNEIKTLRIATSLLVCLIAGPIAVAPAHASWLELAGGAAGSAPQIAVRHVAGAAVEVEIHVPGLELREIQIAGAAYSQVSIPGSLPHIVAGYPELPVVVRALQVPGAGTSRLEILESVWQTVVAPPPVPSRGPLSRDSDISRVAYTFGDVYAQAGVWPAEACELGRPFLVRDRRGVALRVHAVRWDAGAGSLQALVAMRARIVTVGDDGANKAAGAVRPAGRSFAPVFDAIFADSPDAAKDAGADEQQSDANAALAGDRLLMVTASSFTSSVGDLVAWKQERGYSVEVVDVAELGGTAQGIQAAVIERYQSPEGLAHLLLVGDAEMVPTNTGTFHGAASDGMYGLVAGDDLFVDVLVSRLPARYSNELSTMIQRTIAYERDPQPDGDWFTFGAGIASDEGSPADYQRADQLRTKLLAGDYTSVERIYQNQGGSRQQIAATVNSGVSIINYLGHGSGTAWLNVPFNNYDVHQLTNTTSWPWIIDVSCHNGAFLQQECFAEAWLRARHQGAPAGAVAMIAASTAASWVPPTVMQATIIDRLVVEGQTEVGALFAAGVAAVLVQYEGTDEGLKLMEQYNLFGDGTLQVRSRRPDHLVVGHPEHLAAGRAAVALQLPAGSRAVLLAGDEVLARADQAHTSSVFLMPSRDLVAGEEVRLTVTASNALPYRVLLPVASTPTGPVESIPVLALGLDSWPNPFNPQTTVGFALADAGPVRLAVHDARGQLVRSLVADRMPAGSHQVVWDGRDDAGRPVASGVYLARLVTDRGEKVRKLTLAR